jgi:4-hydroxy-3-methylbut-2-en-1-yl diphosphate reductase
MNGSLLVFVPLRIEAAALGRRPGWRVLRTGMGPARARIAAARGLGVEGAYAVVVAGVCGAVSPDLAPGDVVCATELRREDAEPVLVPGSALLTSALRRRGLPTHAGPVLSTDHIAGIEERRRLQGSGALALDMESAWLAEAVAGRPFAVLRVVVETAARSLVDIHTAPAGIRALVTLRRAAPALGEWADEVAPKDVPDSLDPLPELVA